jgi:rhodanese-related sulfurtransferase
MKKIIILVAIVVAVFGGLIWLGKSNSKSTSSQALTFASVQKDISDGAKLYDVRTADEYKAGHFAGAANWSLQDIQAGNMPNVAKDAKIFVYCHSGNRSGQATALLKSAGYTNVTDLHGLTSVESMGGTLITNG